MNPRKLSLIAVLAAALSGSACLKDRSINDPRNGLPPDTLPISISDSTLSFSIETSAMFSGDSLQVFFTIRNNGTTNRAVQGSSSCALTVRAFTLAGTQVSAPARRSRLPGTGRPTRTELPGRAGLNSPRERTNWKRSLTR
jgi:hypothetical protein